MDPSVLANQLVQEYFGCYLLATCLCLLGVVEDSWMLSWVSSPKSESCRHGSGAGARLEGGQGAWEKYGPINSC
jgi:hypothetical protein